MSWDKLETITRANNQMDVRTIFTYLIFTLFLTVIIYIVYRLTFTGVAYSENFNKSIVLIGLVTAMIMMVIGNNLALSLGMVGALSIVRFRAAIKEPKDIIYLFWSISVGLACGTGAILIALVGTIFIAGVVFVSQHKFFSQSNLYLLTVKTLDMDTSKVEEVIKTNVKFLNLRVKNAKPSLTELIYEIRIKPNTENILVKTLLELESVEHVNVVVFSGFLNE